MNSINNKLILEVYKTDKSLKGEISNGFARISQKSTLKGLKVLVDARLSDGTIYKARAVAYIPEQILHTSQWATHALSCDGLEEPFILVDLAHVVMVQS